MKCRDCPHAIAEKTEEGRAMLKWGYKSCAKARTPEERGRYVRGDTSCFYPERLK